MLITFVINSATCIAVLVWSVMGPVRIMDLPFAKAMNSITLENREIKVS